MQLKKVNNNKINPVRKWKRTSRDNSQKEEIQIQMANNHMKKCSTSPGFRETHIKTTMRYLLTPIRMAEIQTTEEQVLAWMWGKGNT